MSLGFGLATVTFSPIPSIGGVLGKVAKDVSAKQSRSRASKPAPSPRDNSSSNSDRSDSISFDRQNGSHYRTSAGHGVGFFQPLNCNRHECGSSAGSVSRKPIDTELRLTYQNVSGSDGSLNGFLRLSHGSFGLAFNSSSYFESDRLGGKGSPEDQTRLTTWDVTAQVRSFELGPHTTSWVGFGLGQVHSNAFETLSGGVLAGHVRHSLSPGLHILGSARGMIYTDDIKAGELRAAVTASVLHLGYRYLEFNAGPPLHGPELGIALSF